MHRIQILADMKTAHAIFHNWLYVWEAEFYQATEHVILKTSRHIEIWCLIKSMIDRLTRDHFENATILKAQPIWTLFEMTTLWLFYKCIWLGFHRTFCCTWQAKYHHRPLRTGKKRFWVWPWPWPWPWPVTLKQVNALKMRCQNTIFIVWPWPLTYDLDLQSQPSQGQGWSSCKQSRS